MPLQYYIIHTSTADKDEDSESDSKHRPGRDTLERDNMLLREQVKLLKGKYKKLKHETKEYCSKFQDDGECDIILSTSSSQSESVSSCVVSPHDTPPSSKGSSRVPSESPSHEETTSSERTRLHVRQSLSPPNGNSSGSKSEGGVASVKSEERSNLRLPLERQVEEREVDNDEIRDVPGSLPSSSGVGIGASATAGSQNGFQPSSVPATFTPKSKPVPVPRSTTLSVGGASDVVKANERKVTHGFLMRGQSLDSVPSSTVKTVKLESFTPKSESPVPKPRVIANQSQVATVGDSKNEQGSNDNSNKMKEKEKSQAEEKTDKEGADDSNKEKEKEKLKAILTLQNLLPHTQRSTKPTPQPRSLSAREADDGVKKEVLIPPRATSSSPIGKVGIVTLGEKGPVFPEKQPGKGSIEETDGDEDERAVSMTSSTSSVNKTSPLSSITKPLPPPPSSSVTKPLPSTPSSSIPKPLPPVPLSSSVPKPLPPTPLSSSVPKPLPPTPSSSTTKPLPPTPIKVDVATPPPATLSAVGGGKEKSGSTSPKTPTSRLVTGYKKVTIQSDTSWINRRKEAQHESTDHPLETSTQSTGSASGSVTTPTSIQSPGTNRSHAPYRSHPIMPGPSTASGGGSKTSLLSLGVSYGGPMEFKPGKYAVHSTTTS